VSNEKVDSSQTEYPNATAWYKTQKGKAPRDIGKNFVPLGDFGGNMFYATRPEALPAKHDPVQGMTPVEKLRYYAAQARAEAAAEFEKLPAHMKLIHRMTASHGQERSFAPVSRRPGTAEADHRHPATSSLPSAAPTAHRVLMPSMPTAGQKQNAGLATKPHAAHATATPQNEAAQTSPPVFHDETLDLIDRNVSQIGAAMRGLNSRGLISSLPSIAPIRPLHAPAQNAPDRVGHAALQPADIAPAGRHMGMAAPHPARRHHASDEAGQAGDMAHHKAAAGRGRHELERQIRDLLDRQARLPPAGPSFFDPALSPAWAGLKIPT
jgi:hypothetical protein